MCIPFCCLISRILKLKGIYPMTDESPYSKLSPINMRTFNASIGHSRKRAKPETSASHSGSHFSTFSLDEKLDHIVSSVHELNTKMSGLTSTLLIALDGIWSLLTSNSIGSNSEKAGRGRIAYSMTKRGSDRPDQKGRILPKGECLCILLQFKLIYCVL